MYDTILLEQSLIYNRRKDENAFRDSLQLVEEEEEERNLLPDAGKDLKLRMEITEA